MTILIKVMVFYLHRRGLVTRAPSLDIAPAPPPLAYMSEVMQAYLLEGATPPPMHFFRLCVSRVCV